MFDDALIYVFGGYNKEIGTLASIERYDIAKKRITTVPLKLPQSLRRFASVKISSTKILLLGGIGRLSKDSDAVYCFDADNEQYSVEQLDKIERPGAVDYPVILDSVG